jgi:hypothetical protein
MNLEESLGGVPFQMKFSILKQEIYNEFTYESCCAKISFAFEDQYFDEKTKFYCSF